MKAALAFALSLVLCAPAPARAADEAALWNAAFALDSLSYAKEAEATLLSGGAPALAILVKVARSAGDSAALQAAAADRCPHFFLSSGSFRFMSFASHPSDRPGLAAALASKLLAADPSLARGLLSSRSAFDRALGILASAQDEARLAEALRATREDSDPLVAEVAEAATHCAAPFAVQRQAKANSALAVELKAVEERSERLQAATRCEEPGFLAGVYLDGLLSGRFKVEGWTRSNDDFTVAITRDQGQRSSLAPACALAIYDAAARRQRFLPALAVPIAECLSVAAGTRNAAAQRAVRDLDRFDEQERNGFAARLVVAGYRVPSPVTFDAKNTFGQDKELEAAARQGNQEALAALETKMFCPADLVDDETHLLGFSSAPETSDRAAQIAERCPRSRCEAVAALVRLGDPRAVKLLGKVFSELGACFGDSLERAILERPSSALVEELRRLAAADGHEAKTILEHLQRDGLIR
ncbi:MAG TPA: hypothetical protein VGK67_09385 [Myxococcales bacterium]|jgi:hypothetical protein